MPRTSVINERTTLDRSSGVPLYVQIREVLRELLGTGALPSGAMVPPESVLAREFKVSRMTLRQALASLEADGLLVRRQGVGTMVSFPKFNHETQQLTSFSSDMIGRGLTPGSRVLRLERTSAPANVARMLRLDTNGAVWLCERLRLADSQPVGVHTSYLPASRIDLSEFDGRTSLYDTLEAAGRAVFRADEMIESVAANSTEARELDVDVGSPLLMVTRTTYCEDGDPIEVVYARYRNDIYRYSLSLSVTRHGQHEANG